jgi:hypothetical protein
MKNTNGNSHESVEHALIGSREEFDALIDREAQRLLGISGEQFMRLREEGRLPERIGVRTLAMMADLASVS